MHYDGPPKKMMTTISTIIFSINCITSLTWFPLTLEYPFQAMNYDPSEKACISVKDSSIPAACKLEDSRMSQWTWEAGWNRKRNKWKDIWDIFRQPIHFAGNISGHLQWYAECWHFMNQMQQAFVMSSTRNHQDWLKTMDRYNYSKFESSKVLLLILMREVCPDATKNGARRSLSRTPNQLIQTTILFLGSATSYLPGETTPPC